ncbi:MAG: ATP-binding protein [Bacillota bacterium]|nr:ATP-binding protein [Bacillota bacterium]
MNENKRTKSISRKINRSAVLEQLSSFIVIDIILLVLAVCLWCYSVESADDNKVRISADRGFDSVTSLELNDNRSPQTYQAYRDYQNAGGEGIKVVFPKSFREGLTKIMYVYENDNGRTMRVYAGDFFLNLFSCLYILLLVEMITLICNAASGARKIRRQLEPLDDLAFKAQMLSSAADFNQQDLDELEKAIEAISPAKDGAKLHTGNAEMEHLEKAINDLLERMRESYRQQSRFVSDASHELRTPLSVLQGYVNMLDRWGKEDETILEESIDAIKSETEHMKKLVEQLLFLARGDSGKTKLTMEPFSLNHMMQEVLEESAMIDKDHVYDFKPAAEDIEVTGDISMLKQTARILIDNAAKYTPAGSSILLKTTMQTEGASGQNIPTFTIQDEGIGIAGSDVSHVFERFYRSDPARSKDGGGTGLGLSIAKWIVDRHGGHFEVLSREDIGTRITVCLPQTK